MRILHAPVNIANQSWEIRTGLRKLGYECDTLIDSQHRNRFGYPSDFNLYLDRWPYRVRHLPMTASLVKYLPRYDIFHFHGGESFLTGNLDLPILKKFGKKLVMHYWGTDIRRRSLACYQEQLITQILMRNEEDIIKMLSYQSRYIDLAIVADNELKKYIEEFYPHIALIPLAINLDKIEPVYPEPSHTKPPLIVHAPSRRVNKGTEHILRAIEKLEQENQPFEFKLIEGMTNQEARQVYIEADIIVDQLYHGYAYLAIEAMALGKSVVSNIGPGILELRPPGLPIVITNPNNVYDKLKWLLNEPQLRHSLGRQGRKYVTQVHSVEKIAEQLVDLYQSL